MLESLLTVIIPNFNHGYLIKHALDSLEKQITYPKNIIIIDDASTDTSISVIEDYIKDKSNIVLVQHRSNKGVNFRCNEGLGLVETKYVFFMAADDVLMPEHIHKSLILLENSSDASICSSLSFIINEDGIIKQKFKTPKISRKPIYLSPKSVRKKFYIYGSWFMGNTTIYNTNRLKHAGGFPNQLGSYADNFITTVLAMEHGACFIPEFLACWRKHDSSYSAKTTRQDNEATSIMMAAKLIINNEYNNLFTIKLFNRWVKRWVYDLCVWNINTGNNIDIDNNIYGNQIISSLINKSPNKYLFTKKVLLFIYLRHFDLWHKLMLNK